MRVTVSASGDPSILRFGRKTGDFLAVERRYRTLAAATATDTTRRNFSNTRPVVPSRAGRLSTGGRLASYAKWTASAQRTAVTFNVAEMDRVAPYWFIQEIGTGNSARMLVPTRKAGRGRPSKIDSSFRKVPSQKGRIIPLGIVFQTGGVYSPPQQGRLENTALASQVTGLPRRYRSRRPMVIKREIQPKGFVKKGADAGFTEYQRNVIAAARKTFGR